MKRFSLLLFTFGLVFGIVLPGAGGAEAVPVPEASSAGAGATSAGAAEQAKTTAAAAAAAATIAAQRQQAPDFLEHLVDSALEIFDMRTNENTAAHFAVSALLLVIALCARRIVTHVVFALLRKVASRTSTTADDKLFGALEAPAAAFVLIVGLFAALRVLKLSPETDIHLSNGSHVALTLVIFWALWRALSAVFDHIQEVSRTKNLGVAAFMPWIKKTVLTVFVVLAVLLTIQSMGYDVKAILAGLGIGGLAFALAAQDTLANVFGAIVVAVDQPFRLGETVRIGTNVGGVEDIGLRSTRIRLVDKSLMVIPNKTVAAETITNLSRFTRRRFEQVIGLTYDTKPAQMDEMVEEIRRIITSQPEVDAPGVMVFFRDFSASSLDIWVVYETPSPDFQAAMRVKQRINLEIMRAVEARGLSFAFPTQTIHLAGDVAERLAHKGEESPRPEARPPADSR